MEYPERTLEEEIAERLKMSKPFTNEKILNFVKIFLHTFA